MALGPHQLAYVNEDKVNAAERLVDEQLSDVDWLNANVGVDGCRRRYWTVRVNGSYTVTEANTLAERYRDAGWGYVTTGNYSPSGFNLELCERELK